MPADALHRSSGQLGEVQKSKGFVRRVTGVQLWLLPCTGFVVWGLVLSIPEPSFLMRQLGIKHIHHPSGYHASFCGYLWYQFSSVAQPCPTLCNPMDCSTPGFPVHHQHPEFTQTHVHRVGDASSRLILCHPFLLLPLIFSSTRVFSNELVLCIRWPKYWSFSISTHQTIYSVPLDMPVFPILQ